MIEQRFRLRELLRYNLKTFRAYLLKEAFEQLFLTNLKTIAREAVLPGRCAGRVSRDRRPKAIR
jgi:hypothetical protein